MFSQWATKRICKFFMKRLLGRMLRSELDLDQLEVQLGFGTIQLKELLLNTVYLNDQLGDAAVSIKEGSVGSIRAKIPWKVLTAESCEIQVDELKLVVVPRVPNEAGGSQNRSSPINDDLRFVDTSNCSAGDVESIGLSASGGCAYMGVDDGVRMIAKMVERVLLGLRVKVTNMIIVFEEQAEKFNNGLPGDLDIEKTLPRSVSPHSLLIARVTHMEYGVEAPHYDPEKSAKVAGGTEPSMLVKVVKFRGATVEIVDVKDEIVECEKKGDGTAAINVPVMHFIGQPVFIIVGENGCLTGSIQLSVPWKHGTMDVPKVHADFAVGPVRLRVSPHQIQQLLNLTLSFSNGTGSSVVPVLASSMPNLASLGNLASSRGLNSIAADKKNGVPRTFSACLSSTGVRGVEANSSHEAFLPVTRFISDWMHWAGSEAPRKDGSVAEADLAASVDEFFECFDGTRSSQAGLNSSGMWSWTCSAFSAITAASSLAAGSLLIAPDPPKQPEYSLKATLVGIFMDLYYDSSVMEKSSLVPTLASELCPLKEVSARQAIECGSRSLQDSTNLGIAMEHIRAQLSELNLSLMVSGCQAEFSAIIKDLDVSEIVLKEIAEEGNIFGTVSAQSHVKNDVPVIQLLQSSIENALPYFPATLSRFEPGSGSPREGMGISSRNAVGEEGLMGSSHLFEQPMASSEKYEEKQLLRVLSEPECAACVTVSWQSSLLMTGSSSGQTEVVACLQPLVVWLDVHTLKRIQELLHRSMGTVLEGKAATKLDDGHNSSMAQESHNLKQRHGSVLESNDLAILERGAFQVKLFAPSVRMIICFPVGSWPSSSGPQNFFIALDLNAPVAKLGVTQPIVDFKHLTNSKTLSSPFSADTLLLHIGDIAVNLMSAMDESFSRQHLVRDFSVTTDEILFISQHDSLRGSLPTQDSQQPQQSALVEIQWHNGGEFGSWVAKRAWDGIAAQQRQGDGGCGIGGSNSEFAAAITAAEAVEEENLQLRKELLSCSSSVVHVNVPRLKIRLSESQFTRVLELIGCFIEALVDKEDETGADRDFVDPDWLQPRVPSDISRHGSHPSETLQTSILVHCGHVDIALYLKAQHMIPGITKQGEKVWDMIRVNLEKLQVLAVHGIGGRVDSSYLWVHHEDSKISGSFHVDDATGLHEEPEMLLLCCKKDALGRGDGGGGNALAAGKAGLTFTYMVWPGQEQLGDALLTGTIRGITFVAHSGRLDWLSAVISFFNSYNEMESSKEMSLKSGIDVPIRKNSKCGPVVTPSITRTYFLLDLHDVALSYEPGSEAILVPGVRAGRDPSGQGNSSSAESSQILAPVACVVAAAAVRVSSSVVPRVTGEQYDIWLRDAALHLLDTTLRKQTYFDYTTESMLRIGYVQIAKEAVMEAFVRKDDENGLQWEVECANNQLRLDTCHDTTAAFGRLVAQLQQLFAPEFEQPSMHVNSWKGEGRGLCDESPNGSKRRMGASSNIQNIGETEINSINLFEGVLENAFSRVKSSCSSALGDYDVDELQGETYTVVNAPLHGRASSMDSHEFLDREIQDPSGQLNKSLPSTPARMQRPASDIPPEESVTLNSSGLPTFIEDYYVTMQKHAPQPLGIMFSRQTSELPQLPAAPSRHGSRDSTSSGGGREAEGKGGWYAGRGLQVKEDHVPEESTRMELGLPSHRSRQHKEIPSHSRKLSLPRKYPPSVGRVVLRDLSARWRFYGGSDWPTGRVVGQDQKSPCQSSSEESGRQSGVCLEVLIDGMELQYDSFPTVGLYASRLMVSIRDIGVYDCSIDAPWRLVLGYHRSKSRPRESSSQAVKMEMDSVRPDPLAPLEEYRLSIGLLPIRLHLDQRHIDFCIQFFSPQVSSTAGAPSLDEVTYPLAGIAMTGNHELPSNTNDLVEDALLPFFQICEMRPLTIRVDYLPRRVDIMSLRGGNYAELLNLVTWKGIELNLKHVRAAGVHGWSSLSGVIFGEWLEDISQNQVHKFVRGVGPIRPLYAMGSGAAKLLVLPAEHYNKDRRLFRGMQKGAIAFLRSISLEALGLGAHLAAGAHEILQQTELALGGVPIQMSFTSGKGDKRSRAVQPGDTREGLQQACESISQGFERTASSLLGNPLKVYQRGAGAGVAVASALRAAPAAAVAPASAAVGAVHRALLGVRNELDPEKKRESDEKHTGPPPDVRRVR